MEFSRFTEKYTERISSFYNIQELIADNTILQRETLDKIKEKGYTLSNYNGETSEYVDFYWDLKFIENGLLGSWKDNASNDYRQKYRVFLQGKVKGIVDTMK